MPYDKQQIEHWLDQYFTTHSEESLAQLLLCLQPAVEYVVGRYRRFAFCKEDVVQDVMLHLLQRLRKTEHKVKAFARRWSLLFYYWIEAYTYQTIITKSKQYHIPLSLTRTERKILALMDSQHHTIDTAAAKLRIQPQSLRAMYNRAVVKLMVASAEMVDLADVERQLITTTTPEHTAEVRQLLGQWEQQMHNLLAEHCCYKRWPIALHQAQKKLHQLIQEELNVCE